MKRRILNLLFIAALVISHVPTYANDTTCSQALTPSYKLDTTNTAEKMAVLMGVTLNEQEKIWVDQTQELLNRLSQYENYSKEQGDANIGDLPYVQNELNVFIEQTEIVRTKWLERVANDEAFAQQANVVTPYLTDTLEELKTSRSTKKLTYRRYFEFSFWMAHTLRTFRQYANSRDWNLELSTNGKLLDFDSIKEYENEFDIFTSHPAKPLFIPTTHSLNMDLMNLFSGQKIAFGGIVFVENIYADGRRYTSDRFFEHDIDHLTNMTPDPKDQDDRLRSGVGDIALIKLIFEDAPAKQMRMRRMIWFHFWHEYGSEAGPLPHVSRAVLFGRYLRKAYEDGIIGAVHIRVRIKDAHDMGGNVDDIADYKRNFENTFTALKSEFP